jgi:type II secretory pathway predicted ATPase ExeA
MMQDTGAVEIGDLIDQVLRRRDELDMERYAALKLTTNPFPLASIASPDLARFSGPLDADVRREVTRFLRTTISGGRFAGLRIVGDYGSGKTHLLRWLEFQITENGRGRIRAYYVENPHRSPREMIFALTRSIGEEELRKQIWSIILEEVKARYSAEGVDFLRFLQPLPPHQVALPGIEENLLGLVSEQSLAHYQRFVETFSELRLHKDRLKQVAAEALHPTVDNLEVVSELVDFALEERYSAFRSWMALSSAETRKKLVVPQQDHFRAIVNVLRRNGVQYVYLLVDEFEDISSARLTKRQQAEYAAALRLLIESNLNDFALVIAVTEKGWDDLREVYPAIEKRFTHVASLKPLDKNAIRELVRRYLGRARLGTDYEDIVETPIAPFSEEALSAIHELVERNPRAVVGFCHRLLEISADRAAAVIDRGLVEELLGARTR